MPSWTPATLKRRSTGVWGTQTGWPQPNGLQIAADRPENRNGSILVSNYTGINSEVPHIFVNGTGRYLEATYVNWGTAFNGQDLTGANDETFEGALHDPTTSAIYRAHFIRIRHNDGTITELPDLPLSVTIGPGDEADAIIDVGASWPAGSKLIERCYVSVLPGQSMVLHRPKGATGAFAKADSEGSTYSAGETNKVTQLFTTYPNATNPVSGGNVVGTSGTSWFGKWAASIRHVDAPPAQLWYPTLVVGDSLTAGPFGWWTFLNQFFHIPHVTIAETGEQARTFLLNDWQSKYRRRFAALGGYQRGIIQYGTNDLVAQIPTQTLTIFQNNLSALLALYLTWGLAPSQVIVGVLPPTTKSTDGWTTLANQTLNMASNQRGKNEQVLLDYNAWLRSGTQVFGTTPTAWHHANGFYVADGGGSIQTMDSSPGDTPSTIAKFSVISGQAATLDGLHPGTTIGKNTWAGAIPAAFFQQSTGS